MPAPRATICKNLVNTVLINMELQLFLRSHDLTVMMSFVTLFVVHNVMPLGYYGYLRVPYCRNFVNKALADIEFYPVFDVA